jgi:hypothetical protein
MKFKLAESTGKYLYHVTNTDKIPKIKKKGLIPMQTSNWVKGGGERYGAGEIYAFEHPRDAVNWAAKMDWDLNTWMGTGKISIIKFKNSGDWDIDENDPITQMGKKGNWVKKFTRIMPEDIISITPFTEKMAKRLISREDAFEGEF